MSVDRRELRALGLLFVGGFATYLTLRPLLGLGHELTVAALAWLLHAAVDTHLWEPLVQSAGIDPIYAGAAIRAVGGVQVLGLGVAGPFGTFLHGLAPNLLLGPESVVHHAAMSMVAAPGAPALGRALATFGADVLWLSLGLWLFWRWRAINWPFAIVGALIQAQIGVNHLLTVHVPLADMDASGMPFALQVAMPNGGWLTDRLAGMPSDLRDLLIGATLLLLAYLVSAALVVLLVGASRLLRVRRLIRLPRSTPSTPMRSSPVLISAALALLTAWSPVGALAVGASNWQTSAAGTDMSLQSVPARTSRHTLRVSGATPVSITHPTDTTWQYVVDGMPEAIRGVGYGPTPRARAQAFADFLPVLVDRIHQVDPNHPVLYRDAEDQYLPWITTAFAQAGGSRPWLVYGANVYSSARLQQIVANWPVQWPGQALVISEFAPGGMSPTDRPQGFQQQWDVIRSRPETILGGLAYTWATNGPEDLDRVFGLVDPNGVPTDGGLATLSTLYLSDTALAESSGSN